MRIELISNLFAPDELAGASLYSDMARFFYEQGHDIRVTTTFSYYPAWDLRPEDHGVKQRDEVWNGIPVRRISMYVPKQPSGLKRIFSDLSFLCSILSHPYTDDWIPEVVITASPMFSQCLAQRFLYRGKQIPRLIIVQDFVVDAALELGILKIPGIGIPLRWLESWSFRSAQTLSTISQPMLEKLEEIVGSDRRLVHIPNWIHGSLHKEIERQKKNPAFRSKLILFYSGNLGVKQGLHSFIDVFSQIKNDWSLEIHGGGAEKIRLEAIISSHPRVFLGSVLDEESYVQKLLATSACLITQASGVGANFLPSKLLPAIATGTPVLAVCDRDSPLGREVLAGGFGAVVSPNNLSELEQTLESWESRPETLQIFSENAFKWAKKYQRENILSTYEMETLKLVN